MKSKQTINQKNNIIHIGLTVFSIRGGKRSALIFKKFCVS